jgi:hypothetical protein
MARRTGFVVSLIPVLCLVSIPLSTLDHRYREASLFYYIQYQYLLYMSLSVSILTLPCTSTL